MTRRIVMSIHDVAPSTIEEVARWREIVSGISPGPVSLLLVPRYRGRDSWRAGPAPAWARERAAAGDEIVLQGYSHLRRGGGDGAELAGRPPGDVRSDVGGRALPSLGAGRLDGPPAGALAGRRTGGGHRTQGRPRRAPRPAPADLRHPRLARSGRDLLARLLDQGRRPVTHGELWPAGRAGQAGTRQARPRGRRRTV